MGIFRFNTFGTHNTTLFMIFHTPKSLPYLVSIFLLLGCTQNLSSQEAVVSNSAKAVEATYITGQVVFPKAGVALPAGTTALVKLVDVSLMDVAEVLLSKQEFPINSTDQLAFKLPYEAARMKPQMSYAVSARIEHKGQFLYINDTRTPVINHGPTSNVQLKVIAIAR
jgi:putative lipoprotein